MFDLFWLIREIWNKTQFFLAHLFSSLSRNHQMWISAEELFLRSSSVCCMHSYLHTCLNSTSSSPRTGFETTTTNRALVRCRRIRTTRRGGIAKLSNNQALRAPSASVENTHVVATAHSLHSCFGIGCGKIADDESIILLSGKTMACDQRKSSMTPIFRVNWERIGTSLQIKKHFCCVRAVEFGSFENMFKLKRY